MKKQVKQRDNEIDKLKRVVADREADVESEKKRFGQKWERKLEEIDKERGDWKQMYGTLNRQVESLKNLLHDKDSQANTRRSNDGNLLSFRSSHATSPHRN